MDKVEEASLASFPASDPLAFMTGTDAWVRPDIPLKERKVLRAAQGVVAMADYRNASSTA